VFASVAAIVTFALPANQSAAQENALSSDFRTSKACSSCHGAVKISTGKTASIDGEWGASIMANSARDPYWLASVRREVLDHPESSAAIQNDCATCHMPLQHLQDKAQGHETAVFTRLPLNNQNADAAAAADGVSCAVCHQIQPADLGTPATYNGNLAIAPPATQPRPVFGPFTVASAAIAQLHVATAGYAPTQSAHIREAGLCASCHTLYTTAFDPDGKPIGRFPEQMPYLEWLQSDYRDKQTCQQCHMPAVDGQVAVATLLAQPRDEVRHHSFIGANAFMLDMLSAHNSELGVSAQPADMAAAIARTTEFMQSQSARLTLGATHFAGSQLSFSVRVENLSGHKLPTAFPSRRAWLHVVVITGDGHLIFESGKLNPDGSIAGNANDTDPTRYSPHFTQIKKADQVEIFETILGDSQGKVTTGVLTATQYLKDNRILPAGFDKKTAPSDIAVHGEAAADPDFTGGSNTTRYAISTNGATGPFHISAELIYLSSII
jgi:hypothetical protein